MPGIAAAQAEPRQPAAGLSYRLAPPQQTELDTFRQTNAKVRARGGRSQRIGFQRQISVDPGIAPISSRSPNWLQVVGGKLLRIDVTSPGAAGLRLELRVSDSFDGELRFTFGADTSADHVLGPYSRPDWQGQPTYWGPVTAGETSTIEVFAPESMKSTDWQITVLSLSHLVVLPTDRNSMGNIYPDTGSCEVNVACVSTPDLIQAAKAVAGMSFIDNGDSYVCTGSLAKDAGGSGTPYFYTAHHCVYSQAIASTLNTFWNFQDSRCAGVTDPYRAQTVLTRGATYLDSESDNDHSLLQLKEQAPASATFLDWDTNDLVARASIVTIHQPNGDVKKVSYGQIAFPATDNVSMSGDNGETIIHSNTWSVIWKTGVTEGGSSGAPLLTCDGKTCKMRGGLIGGSSVCRSDNGPDYFSKLSVALPRLKKWLATSSTAASPSIPTNLQLDCLFNWAEANYASLFAPPRSSSVSSTSYYYRQYSGTGAYLGSSTTDQHLYYIGPASARQLVDLGTISKWGNTAKCF